VKLSRYELGLAHFGLKEGDVTPTPRWQVHKTDGCRVFPHFWCMLCDAEVEPHEVEWRTWRPAEG
jgi:hypothetical protein